jgi:hypothetical protein
MKTSQTREQAQAFLESLRQFLKIDPASPAKLEFDRHNECIIKWEDRFTLMFYLDEEIGAIIVNVPLGTLPADESRLEVMFELLAANYSWNLTEGGTLGVDRETGIIALSYLVDLPLEPISASEAIIAKLINVSDYWDRKIKSIAGAYAPAAPPPEGLVRA